MDEHITGMMIYYYFVCKRKLWYFCHELNMENENENVVIGKILDENSYSRETKHINIDDNITIDFIKEKNIIHEVKKSRAIEEAGIWQTKYYLYYLKKRGANILKAEIDYPLLKQNIEVTLNTEDTEYIEKIIAEIQNIKNMEHPKQLVNLKICKKCAYFDLCYI